mmetsp:Transcript_74277/g.207538  ORF Transcript_74277/g.207538 Transcript_74277/m.207538 type:complete len:251 (+) Transcript_74277:562-1314(+)
MRQAVAQEYVLSKLVELLLERFHAVVDAALELPHGPQGQHLDGTVQPVLAVAQEDALVLVLEVLVVDYVLLEARGHENCVRVDLHGPVAGPEGALGADHVPGLHEDRRVDPRARGDPRIPNVAELDRGHVDLRRLPPGEVDRAAVAEDRVRVAAEDAGPLLVLRREELWLGALLGHPDDAEAEERRRLLGRGCHLGRRGRGGRARHAGPGLGRLRRRGHRGHVARLVRGAQGLAHRRCRARPPVCVLGGD